MNFDLLSTSPYPFLQSYKQLWCGGNKELLNKICITIVGSRKISSYGKQTILQFCKSATNYNIATVSGYVDGVDFEVFKNSLLNKIPTIICLGYGVNYFEEQKFLNYYNKYSTKTDFSDVLVVSQFEKSQNATRWTFPKRDGLLASIGKTALVVEAGEKSGTFYTVKQAIKEQKKVFAVPGSIFSSQSKGTNNLIKKGFYKTKAQIYTEPDDVFLYLKLNCKNGDKKSDGVVFTPTEGLVLKALTGNSHHFDDIVSQTKISPEKLSAILTKLELKEAIKFDGKGYFRIR